MHYLKKVIQTLRSISKDGKARKINNQLFNKETSDLILNVYNSITETQKKQLFKIHIEDSLNYLRHKWFSKFNIKGDE